MKLQWLAPLALGVLASAAHADDPAPQTDKDRTSYAVGVDLGRNLRSVGADIQVDAMTRGLRDGLTGSKAALPDPQIRQLVGAYRADLEQKQQAAMQRAKIEHQQKSEKFLAEYRKKEGVTALPDGMMYRVLRAGSGNKPAQADTVAVNYSGRLIDGTEFDASEPGKPATFQLNAGVIKGWREALQRMEVGAKWEVVLPPALAYGDRGVGRDIPPASTLVFDIELVSIAASAAPKPDVQGSAR